MMELEIQTMQPGERLYAYRQSTQLEGQTGGIGRLRGDFGRNGREFFTTWEDAPSPWLGSTSRCQAEERSPAAFTP